MNHVLSCPIDQLHIGGYLACDIDVNDSTARQRISDLRYIAAKRLKTCESSEFYSVSNKFKLQRDLMYQIVRSGKPLPPSPKDWLPAVYDSLDAAILYWGMMNDEEEENCGTRLDRSGAGSVSKCVPLEQDRVDSRRALHENAWSH